MRFQQGAVEYQMDLEWVWEVKAIGNGIDLLDNGLWTNEPGSEIPVIGVQFELFGWKPNQVDAWERADIWGPGVSGSWSWLGWSKL